MKSISDYLLRILIEESIKKESEKTTNQNTLEEIIPKETKE